MPGVRECDPKYIAIRAQDNLPRQSGVGGQQDQPLFAGSGEHHGRHVRGAKANDLPQEASLESCLGRGAEHQRFPRFGARVAAVDLEVTLRCRAADEHSASPIDGQTADVLPSDISLRFHFPPCSSAVVDHFGAVSFETQKVEGHWRSGGVTYRGNLVTIVVDVPNTLKNRRWMKQFKLRWKERLEQVELWVVSYEIEVD